MSDLHPPPEETLRRYAKRLNALSRLDPSARPWYDYFGDALTWQDETLYDDTMELIGPIRSLWVYRTGLIIGEKRGIEDLWRLGQKLFPNWVGFHSSRCNRSDELARIYHAYSSNFKRELDEMFGDAEEDDSEP